MTNGGYKVADLIEAIDVVLAKNTVAAAEALTIWEEGEGRRWKLLRDHITSQSRKGKPVTTESLAGVLGSDRWGHVNMPERFEPPTQVALLDYNYSLRNRNRSYRNIYASEVVAMRGALHAWEGESITDRQLQTMGFKQMVAAVFTAAAVVREVESNS